MCARWVAYSFIISEREREFTCAWSPQHRSGHLAGPAGLLPAHDKLFLFCAQDPISFVTPAVN